MYFRHLNYIAAALLCAAVLVPTLASAAAISGQGTWETSLQGRDLDGNLNTIEAFFDTTLNITWLADANYASTTSGFVSDGKMNWTSANNWAANLNFNGIGGWRLPTMTNTTPHSCIFDNIECGYNVSSGSSEMAHMYYATLGNQPALDSRGYPNINRGSYNSAQFINLGGGSGAYWSGTSYSLGTLNAYYTGMGLGDQDAYTQAWGMFAWAVHTGDVGSTVLPGAIVPIPNQATTGPTPPPTSAVPVPTAGWLLGSGLLGLIGVARRKAA